MASRLALFLAVLFHVGFKILVFMDASPQCCSLQLNLRSILYLSSVIMYLSTTRIFPRRYRRVPEVALATAEFFIFLVVIEIAMVVVWCRIEALLYALFESLIAKRNANLYSDMGNYKLVEHLQTLCSILTFAWTAMGTGYMDSGTRLYENMSRIFHDFYGTLRCEPAQPTVCPANCVPMEGPQIEIHEETPSTTRSLRARSRSINYSEFARAPRRSSSRHRSTGQRSSSRGRTPTRRRN